MFGELNNEVVGYHDVSEWEALVVAWGFRCFYCGRPVAPHAEQIQDELTKDHLVPLSRGGVDFIWNIVPACFNCNRLKGSQTVDEFRQDRPVFFTAEQNARRKSFEEDALGRNPQGVNSNNSNFAQQTVDYLSPLRRMEKEKQQIDYPARRALLRSQVAEIKRLRLVDAGQLTLPIFGDNAPKKLMETEAQALTLQGMSVTPLPRKGTRMTYLAIIGWALFCLLLVALAVAPLFRRRPEADQVTMCQCGHEQCFHGAGRFCCFKRLTVATGVTLCDCAKFVPAGAPTESQDKEVSELRKMAGL